MGDNITRRGLLAAVAGLAVSARPAPGIPNPQSSTWRGSLRRDGFYLGGVRRLPSLHWTRIIGGRGIPPPAVAAGLVCVGRNVDQNLLAVDAGSGRPVWDLATGHVSSTPAIERDTVYLSSEHQSSAHGLFLAVDLHSGRHRWHVPSPRPENLAPAVVDDFVYFISTTRTVLAFDRRTGALRWRFQFASHSPYRSGYTAPAVHDDVIYFGGAGRMSDGADASYLFAIDRFSGRLLWRAMPKADPASLVRGQVLEHTPVIAGGLVLGVSRDTLFGFDSGGRLLWSWQSPEGPITAPAVHDGVAYLGGTRHLLAVDLATGCLAWRWPAGGRIATPPSVAAGAVCFGVVRRQPARLVAVDLATRRPLWEFTSLPASDRPRSGAFSSPVFLADRVFVTNERDLYCLG